MDGYFVSVDGGIGGGDDFGRDDSQPNTTDTISTPAGAMSRGTTGFLARPTQNFQAVGLDDANQPIVGVEASSFLDSILSNERSGMTAMEDYSESSSVRMEREMMQSDTSSSHHPPSSISEHNNDALLDEASDSSLAAFNDEIQRMTRDADRLLNDILGKPNANSAVEEEGDAELQEELEALDEVSRRISMDVVHHDTLHQSQRNLAAAVAETKKNVVPVAPELSKPATTTDASSLVMAVAVIWAMVFFMLLHAKFRLVDEDGYLRVFS